MDKPKVLVIDDDAMARTIATSALEGDYVLKIAENGAEGIRLFKEEQPDVIILDIVMPELDGLGVLNKLQLKLDDPYDVIAVTGMDSSKDKQIISKCYDLGVSLFIHKPLNTLELKGVMKRCIELKKLEEERKKYQLEIQQLNADLEARVVKRTLDLENEVQRRRQAEEAQKELLESTLKGTIQVLVDILALISPAAFNRARRMRDYVAQLAHNLNLDDAWKYELAAMLSQMGCVTIPNKTFQKFLDGANLTPEEESMINAYPEVARKLLINIPHLEEVSGMIGQYMQLSGVPAGDKFNGMKHIETGGELIRIALDFDDLLCRNYSLDDAIEFLKNDKKHNYSDNILDHLHELTIKEIPSRESAVQKISIDKLKSGLILQEDIVAGDGTVVASKGHEVNRILLRRLQNFLNDDLIDNERVRAYQPGYKD